MAVISMGMVSTPQASLTLLTRTSVRTVNVSPAPFLTTHARPFHCSFMGSSTSLSFPSSFSGVSLGVDLNFGTVVKERRRVLQVRAGKAALCLTKRSRSRKSLARTHGFRRRMRTTGGRAILNRRRAKGRKVLCTKSNPNSGKRA